MQSVVHKCRQKSRISVSTIPTIHYKSAPVRKPIDYFVYSQKLFCMHYTNASRICFPIYFYYFIFTHAKHS